MEVTEHADAGAALDDVSDALRAAGAEGELSYGILVRLTGEPDAWGSEVTMLVGSDDGGPSALVTMTGHLPALIVGFGDPARLDYDRLAEAMEATGRRPGGVNGAIRWSDPFAAVWAARGAQTAVRRELRAFELTRVIEPPAPPGRFREAGEADIAQVAAWVVAMGDDIDEPIGDDEAGHVARRVVGGHDLALWEHDGRPVSMAAITRRTPWSSCVALVYTPPDQRRRGYASAVVAALSQRELDAGREWCSLFTDLANPTSNHIYAELGYEPRCDFRHHELTSPGSSSAAGCPQGPARCGPAGGARP
jgi:hypothetical protein